MPVTDCVVEIWHCDAGGVYSGFESARGGGPGTGPTDDGTYLRGAQVADDAGIVRFTTVYPGWYPGRTVHIHVKVHLDDRTVLTTQLYFDEDTTARVYARSPYDAHTGGDTFNDTDGIFDAAGVVTAARRGEDYLAVANLGIGV